MRRLFLLSLLVFIPSIVLAESTPIGFWQSYDLDNHARNIIQFSIQNGTLVGTIAKVTSFQGAKPICYACEGALHNKPLQGLQIIWGLQKEDEKWVNGQVVDLDNGKLYDCELSVSPDNNTLYFTGYTGIPSLGATIEWTRVKSP